LLTRAWMCLKNRVNSAIAFENFDVMRTVYGADGRNRFPQIRGDYAQLLSQCGPFA